jgi:predicted dehydrogenase
MVECRAVSDINTARAHLLARRFSISKVVTPLEMCTDPEVELVVNLTPPKAHFRLALNAVEGGKHIFNEKPLAIRPDQARRLLATARDQGVRVGAAPATFLGGAWQTCRSLIDDGAIGRPVAVTAFSLGQGYEQWHPRPRPYFEEGAGPLFDMGPYYLSTMVFLLGAVRRVNGLASIAIPERTIGTGRHRGETIAATTPDHVSGAIEFVNGVVGTIATSYAVWHAYYQPMQIFGTLGTISMPMANQLAGPVWLQKSSDEEGTRVRPTHGRNSNLMWAVGVADMAQAIRTGRPHRASGLLGLHVLEVMQGLLDSTQDGRIHALSQHPPRPEPLPRGLPDGVLD